MCDLGVMMGSHMTFVENKKVTVGKDLALMSFDKISRINFM
jgi:hypothetical protein